MCLKSMLDRSSCQVMFFKFFYCVAVNTTVQNSKIFNIQLYEKKKEKTQRENISHGTSNVWISCLINDFSV